ncbi:hypothetical protein [Methanoplanus limicola]|uniref:hypothetical protein n=1 Tax=Methanoplanus limicola TaxID=2315 RepID=UPI0012F6315E|nr:hypothetical protein [Methanoplanus limicola]
MAEPESVLNFSETPDTQPRVKKIKSRAIITPTVFNPLPIVFNRFTIIKIFLIVRLMPPGTIQFFSEKIKPISSKQKTAEFSRETLHYIFPVNTGD